jgi:hypothetical protein
MLRGAERRGVIASLARGALVPAGALAVHQLRYWLAFGSNATAELRAQGHSYLHSLVPWIVLLVAISAGVFLRALGRALGGRSSLPRHTLSFAALWLVCAACLVAVYVCQEFLEGLFATGHPGGLVGIFGYGGWWSVPAALAVGLGVAAVFHGARWVLREIAQRHQRPVGSPRRRASAARAPRASVLLRLEPLADGWSDRGPPR